MAGHLKKIVDYVRTKAVLSNVALATMRLQVGEDVTRVTSDTPDDPERERVYLEAAKRVLRAPDLHIPF